MPSLQYQETKSAGEGTQGLIRVRQAFMNYIPSPQETFLLAPLPLIFFKGKQTANYKLDPGNAKLSRDHSWDLNFWFYSKGRDRCYSTFNPTSVRCHPSGSRPVANFLQEWTAPT